MDQAELHRMRQEIEHSKVTLDAKRKELDDFKRQIAADDVEFQRIKRESEQHIKQKQAEKLKKEGVAARLENEVRTLEREAQDDQRKLLELQRRIRESVQKPFK